MEEVEAGKLPVVLGKRGSPGVRGASQLLLSLLLSPGLCSLLALFSLEFLLRSHLLSFWYVL